MAGIARPESWVGREFGELTVTRFIRYGKSKSARLYEFKCSCGNTVVWWTTRIYTGTWCCGCTRARSKDGRMKKPEYKTFVRVRARMGRLLWKDFYEYIKANPPPSPNLILSRRDVNLPWSLDNLAWKDKHEARARKPVTLYGRTMSQREWADECGISRERIRQRLLKYTPEQAIGPYLR